MTVQIQDIITIGDKRQGLKVIHPLPLGLGIVEDNDERRALEDDGFLDPLTSTACHRGYVAEYKVQDGFIYLIKVHGKLKLSKPEMVKATWLARQLETSSGDIINVNSGEVVSITNKEETIKPSYYEIPAGYQNGHRVYIDEDDHFRITLDSVDRGRLIDENTIKFISDFIDIPWFAKSKLTPEDTKRSREEARKDARTHNQLLFIGRLRAAYKAKRVTIFRISAFIKYPDFDQWKADMEADRKSYLDTAGGEKPLGYLEDDERKATNKWRVGLYSIVARIGRIFLPNKER